MKKYNQKILKAIYRKCEKAELTIKVDQEYYDKFLDIPVQGLKILISCILRDRADDIKRNILSGKWNDNDLYDYITTFLDMIAQGILGITEDGKLVFQKPIGPKPNSETERKIDKKICDSKAFIEEVIKGVLPRS